MALDWDGTCVENVWPDRWGDWLPGSVETIRSLLDEGWEVIIHSCRVSPFHPNYEPRDTQEREEEIATMRLRLDESGLEDVDIFLLEGKPAADVYLDDKGMHFSDWSSVRDALL